MFLQGGVGPFLAEEEIARRNASMEINIEIDFSREAAFAAVGLAGAAGGAAGGVGAVEAGDGTAELGDGLPGVMKVR